MILLVNLALGGFFGSMQLSVSAFAAAHHAAGSAGLLYSILSCASLLSGVLFARRRWHPPVPVQLSLALGFMAAGCLPLLTANSLVWLGAFLLLPGLAIAPSIALSSVLVEGLIDSSVLTQAFTWTNSASAAGVALAASLTGLAVDTYGPHAGFLISAGVVSVAAAAAGLACPMLSARQPGPCAPVSPTAR